MILSAVVVKICFSFSFLIFSFGRSVQLAACGILVPPPGVEPRSSAVEAPSPNHWPARKS